MSIQDEKKFEVMLHFSRRQGGGRVDMLSLTCTDQLSHKRVFTLSIDPKYFGDLVTMQQVPGELQLQTGQPFGLRRITRELRLLWDNATDSAAREVNVAALERKSREYEQFNPGWKIVRHDYNGRNESRQGCAVSYPVVAERFEEVEHA